MRLTFHLADSAQPGPDGKVNALGLGWMVTTSPTQSAALIIYVDLETREELERDYELRGMLVDADNQPVRFGSSSKPRAVRFKTSLNAKSHAEPSENVAKAAGIVGRMVVIVSIGSLALDPGLYSWVVGIAGTTAAAAADFEVRQRKTESPSSIGGGSSDGSAADSRQVSGPSDLR